MTEKNMWFTRFECSQREGERCYPTFCTLCVATEGRCLEDRKPWTEEMERAYFERLEKKRVKEDG